MSFYTHFLFRWFLPTSPGPLFCIFVQYCSFGFSWRTQLFKCAWIHHQILLTYGHFEWIHKIFFLSLSLSCIKCSSTLMRNATAFQSYSIIYINTFDNYPALIIWFSVTYIFYLKVIYFIFAQFASIFTIISVFILIILLHWHYSKQCHHNYEANIKVNKHNGQNKTSGQVIYGWCSTIYKAEIIKNFTH